MTHGNLENGSITASRFMRGPVTIIVPAKNEEAAIGKTLRTIPVDTLRTIGFDVETVILDGQSRDSTRDLAYRHGDTTVVFEEGRGKGQALKYVRQFITSEYVVMMDADGTYAADAIPRLLAPLAWGDAEITMGQRRALPGAMTAMHKIGNRLLSWTAMVLYRRRCPDLCTGMWGFRTSALQTLPLRSRGFDLEAEMFAVAIRMGLKIKHVPMDYLPRKGASKLTHSDGFAILWRLMQSRVSPLARVNGTAPLRVAPAKKPQR